MELIFLVLGLVAVGLAADRFGADSRPTERSGAPEGIARGG